MRWIIVTVSIYCLFYAISAAPSWMSKSAQKAWQLAAEVGEEADEEELTILRTLLEQRSSWHPNAFPLLTKVVRRREENKRRLNASTSQKQQMKCADITDEATCIGAVRWSYSLGMCKRCMWSSVGCHDTECAHYGTQTECCANPNGVETGCYWVEHTHGLHAKCRSNLCHLIVRGSCELPNSALRPRCATASNICSNITHCQYSPCMGCRDDTDICYCSADNSSGHCSTGDKEILQALQQLSCPLFDCAMCMKGSEPIEQLIQKRTTECATRCASSIYCDAQARCLLEDVDNQPNYTCPTIPATAHASCGTIAFTTSTTTRLNYNTCEEMCETFQNTCANPCGDLTCVDAASITSGTRQAMSGLGAILGSMVLLL